MRKLSIATLVLLGVSTIAQAEDALFQIKSLTPETALIAARTAMETCRKQGFQVSVAVVDRSGLTQVLLRDRFAGAHTIDIATNKAWTAASFHTNTSTLSTDTQPGKPLSGLRGLDRFMGVGGGVVIEGAGSYYGGIAVSGAPGGDSDEQCAKAGLSAIADALEF